MSFKNFIPEIWSAVTLKHLEKNLVFEKLVNRDYEGEIRNFGDTVHIGQIGKPTVRDYTGGDIEPPEGIDAADSVLLIDKGKYFNFMVDDIDKRQSMLKNGMSEAFVNAGREVSDAIDSEIALNMTTNAGKKLTNKGAGFTISSAADAYRFVANLRTQFQTAHIPLNGRYFVVPSWFYGLLMQDTRFSNFKEVWGEGSITGLAGIGIVESTNLVKDGGYDMAIGSVKISTCHAHNIVETRAYEREAGFQDAIKSYTVWGTKVLYPSAIITIKLKDGTEVIE